MHCKQLFLAISLVRIHCYGLTEPVQFIQGHDKVKARMRALLLHYAGDDVEEIFDTLEDTGNNGDYKKA